MKTGFIGTGKIAAAIVEGLSTAAIEKLAIYLSPRNIEIATALAKKYSHVHRMQSNQAVLDQADIIFISLTPAKVKEALGELMFTGNHTIISLIPRLKYDELASAVRPAKHACRAIPLPAVSVHNCPVPVFNPNDTVMELFAHIGQPLVINNETDLHTLWSLTGLVSPFYDQLKELSAWTQGNGVDASTANQYIANLYQSLAFMAQQVNPINFDELSRHAATPNGMNEQAAKELNANNAHKLYTAAADNLLKRFK